MIGVSRLLKSWATPPVSWPIASSFCAWRSASSACRRSVMSTASGTIAMISPSALRTGRMPKSNERQPIGRLTSSSRADGRAARRPPRTAARTSSGMPGVSANQGVSQNFLPTTSSQAGAGSRPARSGWRRAGCRRAPSAPDIGNWSRRSPAAAPRPRSSAAVRSATWRSSDSASSCSATSRARASYCRRRPRSADWARLTSVVGMERPLEEGDVAEHLEIAAGGRVALEPAAAPGQQDERESPTIPAAPRSSALSALQVGARQRFLGDQARSRRRRSSSATSAVQRRRRRSQRMPGLGQHRRRRSRRRGRAARGSAPARRDAGINAARLPAGRRRSPTSVGTPRSTPWNSVSGSPSVMPSTPIRYSRIVSSCAPVRFLIDRDRAPHPARAPRNSAAG